MGVSLEQRAHVCAVCVGHAQVGVEILSEAREQQPLSIRRPDWVHAIQLIEVFQVAAISVDDANAWRGRHYGAGLSCPPPNSREGNLLAVRRPAWREQALGGVGRFR